MKTRLSDEAGKVTAQTKRPSLLRLWKPLLKNHYVVCGHFLGASLPDFALLRQSVAIYPLTWNLVYRSNLP